MTTPSSKTCMRVLLPAALLSVCPPAIVAQAEWPRPNWGKAEVLRCPEPGQASTYRVASYQVKLIPVSEPGSATSCRSYLVAPSGHELSLLEDTIVSVDEGTGQDLFGEGNSGVLLEGYTGGAHARYRYQAVDLGDPPLVLPPIGNQTPFYVFRDPATRQPRILTSDGAFGDFEGLCHGCAPFPRVVLQLTRGGLRDVSPQFSEQYDSEIALARAKIGAGKIGSFEMADFADVKPVVLEIIYSYLYSGRDAQAWQALREMWPPGDRERIKRLILDTRGKGLLSHLNDTAPRNAPR